MNNLAIIVFDDTTNVKGQLDLNPNTEISIEYSLSDIREPEKRKVTFTKEFTIPGSKNNNKLLMPFFTNGYSVTNFNPNKRLLAQLTNGSVLMSGILQLKKVVILDDKYEYEVIIYDNVVDFFNEIGDAELKGTINLSKYNHLLTQDNIVKSWTNKITKYGKEINSFIGDGYVYPLEDRGDSVLNNKMPLFEAGKMRPAIYLKTYVDEIFNKYGWTYKSDFFNSEFFSRLVIPFSSNALLAADENETFQGQALLGNNNAGFQVGWDIPVSPFEMIKVKDDGFTDSKLTAYIKEDFSYTNQGNNAGAYDLVTDTFTVKKSGIYNLNTGDVYQIVFQHISSGTSGSWKAQFGGKGNPYIETIIKNDTTGKILGSSIDKFIGFDGVTHYDSTIYAYDYVTAKCSAQAVQLYEGEVIRVYSRAVITPGDEGGTFGRRRILWDGTFGYGPSINNGYVSINYTSSTDITKTYFDATIVNKEVGYGSVVPMNNAIPDNVKLKDLFTSLNKLFNLYWEPTEKEKQLRVEPYEDFFQFNKGIVASDDWTRKLNKDADVEIYPMYELTANNYEFRYKLDNDWANKKYNISSGKVYGHKDISIENDFITDTSVIEPIFYATPNTEYSYKTEQSLDNLVLPSYTTKDEQNVKSKMKPGMRLLYWGGLLPGPKYSIANKASEASNGAIQYENLTTYSSYPYAGHTDNPFKPSLDLNYGLPTTFYYDWSQTTNNNLFNKYWRNWLNSIIDKDSHMLKGQFKLSQLDMNNFNLKNVYQYNHVYYRVNKLTYDVDTQLADVELLRVFDYPEFKPSNGFYVNAGMLANQDPGVKQDPPVPEKPSGLVTWGTPRRPFGPPSRPPYDLNPTWGVFEPEIWSGNTFGTWVEPTSVNMTQYTGLPYITPSPVESYYNVRSADYLPQFNMRKDVVNNNIVPQNDLLSVRGFSNNVSNFIAGPVSIVGNENAVMSGVNAVSIMGSNNTIMAGVTNTTVIGSNQVVTESNAVYIDGNITKNGQSFQRIDLIRGGINEVQNVFNIVSPVTNVIGGRNAVKNFGSTNNIEKINGSIHIDVPLITPQY